MMRARFFYRYRFMLVVLLTGAVLACGAWPAQAQNAPRHGAMPGVLPDMHHIFQSLPPDIQDELLAEANQAQKNCAGHGLFSTYQDCECIKYRILNARLARGPDVSTSRLMNEVATECTNKPAIAGYQYQQCMERTSFGESGAPAAQVEKFCQCVANNVADSYARAPANSIRYQTRLVVNAQIACNNEDFIRLRQLEYQRRRAAEANVLPPR